MRIVVTGSGGKVGSVVVDDLLAAGHAVVLVDVRPSARQDIPETHVLNLTKVDGLAPLFQGADAICHLGNLPGINHVPVTDGFINNAGATYAVFEAAQVAGVRKLVIASSIQAYGVVTSPGRSHITPSTPVYLPIDEDHPLLPKDAYPLTKALAEWTADCFCRQDARLQAFSLRLTGVRRHRVGEGPHKLWPSHRSDIGASLNSAIHAKDAARAFRLCCEIDRPGHTPLNIVSPQSIVPWDAEMFRAFYGVMPELRRPLGPLDCLFTTERAEKILGFRATLLL